MNFSGGNDINVIKYNFKLDGRRRIKNEYSNQSLNKTHKQKEKPFYSKEKKKNNKRNFALFFQFLSFCSFLLFVCFFFNLNLH